MDQTLAMPKLGLTMTEGLVAEWRRAPGESFAAGDVLVVIETDKIASEVEAPAAGRLQTILVAQGQTVPVGTPLAHWVAQDGASVKPDAAKRVARDDALPIAVPMAAVSGPVPLPAAPLAKQAGRIIATPYARRLARERGVVLAALAGGGPSGRIRASDVPADNPSSAGRTGLEPVIASLSGAEHFLLAQVDATALLGWRARLLAASLPVGLASLVLYAVARALPGAVVLGVAGDVGKRLLGPTAGPAGGLRALLATLSTEASPAVAPGHGLLFANAGRGGLGLFCPARPVGWSALLGLGTLAEGRLTLCLRADAADWPTASTTAFLERLVAYLEEPRAMLL